MILYEKKIMKALDFLVNNMCLPSRMFSKCPEILLYSPEKRIISKCLIIKVLLSKGLLKNPQVWTMSVHLRRIVYWRSLCWYIKKKYLYCWVCIMENYSFKVHNFWNVFICISLLQLLSFFYWILQFV